MAASPWHETCVLTVTTEGFAPGTFVTLASFLQHHPGFDGDIVVVAEDLSERSREVLSALSPRLRFEAPSAALADRAARLCEAHPVLRRQRTSFYTLEAFRLGGYRKLLALDGDLLFQANVAALLDSPGELICCPDQFALRGLSRDATTYLPVDDRAPVVGTVGNTFNAGVLLIDGSLLRRSVYDDLVAMVAPSTWRGVKAVNTDQLVLNRYFAGRQTLASAAYNYLVTDAAAIRAREGVGIDAARVLHFKLPIKPWTPEAMLDWARPRPAYLLPSGYKRWYRAFLSGLAATNLRQRAGRRQRTPATPAAAGQAGRPVSAPRRPRERPVGDGVCLATACSEGLVPGTLTMLDSFLARHPAFAGDIVVIDDDLTDASRAALAAVGDVRFERVSAALRARLRQLGTAVPRLAGRLANFHPIEAYRLRTPAGATYRKVLSCDADLLFRGPIDELFETEDALIACPDSPTLRGLARDAKTYGTVSAPSAANQPEQSAVLANTFNCGLLLVDGRELAALYDHLLAALRADTWAGTEVALTDSLPLNRYFAGRARLASSTYNYLIPNAPQIRAREGIELADAKVLHYRAAEKPWQPGRMLHWAGARTDAMLPGYQLWYDAYVDCLARLHMRGRLVQRKNEPPRTGPKTFQPLGPRRPAPADDL